MSKRSRFGPLKKATEGNLQRLPDKPGVYGLFTDAGTNEYIGKVQRGRAQERIEEHKREGEIPFKKFGFIPTESKQAAAALEKTLIRKRKPHYNETGK